jgi:hypothetical protein
MKKYLIIISLLSCTLTACLGVLDSIEPFCFIKNNSKRNITLRYSQSHKLDSLMFIRQLVGSIAPGFTIRETKQDGAFFPDDNKRVYIFVLDADSSKKYIHDFKKLISSNSILQTMEIQLNKIKSTDTLFYNETID